MARHVMELVFWRIKNHHNKKGNQLKHHGKIHLIFSLLLYCYMSSWEDKSAVQKKVWTNIILRLWNIYHHIKTTLQESPGKDGHSSNQFHLELFEFEQSNRTLFSAPLVLRWGDMLTTHQIIVRSGENVIWLEKHVLFCHFYVFLTQQTRVEC